MFNHTQKTVDFRETLTVSREYVEMHVRHYLTL
jgi:hypothetical protein